MPIMFARPGTKARSRSPAPAGGFVRPAFPRHDSAGHSAAADCACGGGCPRCTSSEAHDAGRPLPAGLQTEFGTRLGADLHDVRIHTGAQAAAKAASLQAGAYTRGPHITFGEGRYRPDTPGGLTLLAHELIHVVQQRDDTGQASSRLTQRNHSTEIEARSGAEILAAGGSFHPAQPARGLLQRDDSSQPAASAATPQPNYQLHLDPALMAQMRLFLAQWIATQTGTGSVTAPLTGLSPSAAGGGSSSSFSLAPPFGFSPSLLPRTPSPGPAGQTVPPAALAPTPPDPTFVPPDYSSIYGPYNDRGVPLGGRDRDAPVLDQLYRERWQLVRGLPDLRGMAPPFIRHLIPDTWRRDLASALTGLTAGSQLKHDFPTAIEAADTMFMNMTGNSGAVPTYINPPFPPFKWSF